MRIVSSRDLGRYVQDQRRALGHTQAELAAVARVSRRWLSDLEAGKDTAQVGMVFRTLDALGVVLDAQPATVGTAGVDPDQYLRGFTDEVDDQP